MIKPLTSFRFFFALTVFACHLNFIDPKNVFLTRLYKSVFYEGYLGVSFFFILSGFVLALNYKNRLIEKKITLKEFWVARFARIYPLHFLTLLLAIPLSLNGFLTGTIIWFGKFIINMFLLQSFIPLTGIFFSFNEPSWSISDEMFFYLMFPLIITLYFKYKKAITLNLILLLLIPIGIFLCPQNLVHRLFYINPFFRIADFIIGIMLYDIYERKPFANVLKSKSSATLIELLSICLFALFFAFHMLIPQGYRYSCYYWIPMIVLILVFSYQTGYISAFLSNRIFVLLGEISFGFYLIHQLAIRYIVIINTKFLLISNNYLLIATMFGVTLILSYLSYNFIEHPLNNYIKLKYKKNMADKKTDCP
jgi:peptidoglycan/LPS O-acetylase OafA/YrhL